MSSGAIRTILSGRPHLLFSLALFLFAGAMIVEPSQGIRAGLFVGLLLSFLGFMTLFGLEIESAHAAQPVESNHPVPVPAAHHRIQPHGDKSLPSLFSFHARPRLSR